MRLQLRNLLLSTVCVLSLGGCLMPSGINPSLGCSPLTGCTSKDYYIPGKGVWAPKQSSFNKARIGAIGGAALGAFAGAKSGDPLTAAAYTVVGLVVGHEVGAHLDKVDQIHATLLLQQSLSNNVNGQVSTWSNPAKQVMVKAAPVTTNGNCREFITTVQVGQSQKNMKGTACKQNNEWVLKELYQ